jgi:phage terminase Nu1 subunit (DNA packaging protein)
MMTGQAPVLPIFEPSDFHPHVATAELAEILHISPRRIRELVADGILPREDRGRFDVTRCAKAYIHFLGRPEVAERRAAAMGLSGDKRISSARHSLLAAQAARTELKLAQERGELIPLELYRTEVGEMCVIFRESLVGLAQQIAPQLVGQSEAEIARRLDAAARALLLRLSRGGRNPDQDLQTSAKTDNRGIPDRDDGGLQTSANKEE